MAQVFSNDMVAHVWAQQRQQSGKSGNGNFYFEGRVLYSYGSHFPVGLFIAPGGPVFLNADNYSVSTSRHKSEARAAVSHIAERYYLPGLASVQRLLLSANERGKLPAEQRKMALAYLSENWRSIPADSGGAAWLLRAAGNRGTWQAMRARLEAKADALAARNAARLKATLARQGRELAARPWPEMRESAWLEAGSYRQRELRETIADVRAARLATPKAHKRVRAILWQREGALRAILALADADNSDRHGNPGNRTKARGLVAKLRRFRDGRVGYVPGFEGPDGPDKRQAALDLPTGAGWRSLANLLSQLSALSVSIPPATREAMAELFAKADAIATEREGEETQRREIADAHGRVLRELRTFNAGRRNYARHVSQLAGEERTPETCRALLRSLDSILSHVPSAAPWGAERGFELAPALAARAARINARAALIASELEPQADALRTDWERAKAAADEADRRERERIRNMTADEKRTAWEAGDLPREYVREMETVSGPLLRAIAPEVDGCSVTGGTLETSQGATVPLRHAFRVFQFVAACRAEGRRWVPAGVGRGENWGPRQIRVGHFSLDRVDSSGDFVAGCHSIKWPEIARLADRLGVAGCLATLPEAAAELEGETV